MGVVGVIGHIVLEYLCTHLQLSILFFVFSSNLIVFFPPLSQTCSHIPELVMYLVS